MQPQSKVPEIMVLNCIASIPLVASSLEQINAILEKSMFTCFPYHAAQTFISTTYSCSEPIQIHLSPLIACADNIANKGLNAVESRYPYPFQAKKEVASYVRKTAGKTVENFKSPAACVAEGIDKRIAEKMSNESSLSSESSDSQFQYQRMINIYKYLKDNAYIYSPEHLKQVQRQSILVQCVTMIAQSIADIASKKIEIDNAQMNFYIVAKQLILAMVKIQKSTAKLPQAMQTFAITSQILIPLFP
ncbi:hypothetical protein BDR04DRAFT_1021134 [Suillus decipiens]|nr:hypothetical protein BDR04DRAFT_1021134 [Suillus decipiens]